MMKRILIMLLCAVSMSACLGTHYFEPEVVETSDQEERISYLGDTCWFEVEYQQVMTKFQPGMAFKPFKYVVEIEGIESEEPTVVTNDSELAALTGELKEKFPEFYKEWYKENDDYPKYSRAIIAFAIPANQTQAERKVEVKVSIADDYRSDTENWGEWETVFSAVQEGFDIETSKGGRILIDYECLVGGKYGESVAMFIGEDPIFMDNGICKFVEYDIASPTGRIGMEVYDAKGDLRDTGSIMNFSNPCREFPSVFSNVLPDSQIVAQLLWEVNFEKNGRRTFYVLIVKGEGPHGIFGPTQEVYLFEDITAEYKPEYDIDYAVKRHRLAYVTEGDILVDHLLLDGYKVMFGEYEVSSVISFEEWMPEHLIEPATVKLQAGRKLQDGAKVFLNHDMTYSIVESGNTISSGTYEMGIYEVAPAEWSCYYYPGPCSFMGYLTLTDSNGARNGFGMQVATHQDSSKDYGTPQVYQGFEINEDDMSYLYGIRYGLTYCK